MVPFGDLGNCVGVMLRDDDDDSSSLLGEEDSVTGVTGARENIDDLGFCEVGNMMGRALRRNL